MRSLECVRLDVPSAPASTAGSSKTRNSKRSRLTANASVSARPTSAVSHRTTTETTTGTTPKSRATSARSVATSTCRSEKISITIPSLFGASISNKTMDSKTHSNGSFERSGHTSHVQQRHHNGSTTSAKTTNGMSSVVYNGSVSTMATNVISSGSHARKLRSSASRPSRQRRSCDWKQTASSAASTSLPIDGVTSANAALSLAMFHLGLTVWRLDSRELTPIEEGDIGFFHQGNCYIALNTDANDSTFLHLWQGGASTNTERERARRHLQDLDEALKGASFLSIEHEGEETQTFLSHFEDGFVIVEGKQKQHMKRASKYLKRLYIVEGVKYMRATCNECVTSAVADDKVAILDGYPRIYVWVGRDSDFVMRVKAIKLAKKIRRWQRDGKGHIVVVDASETYMSEAFLRKLEDDDRGHHSQLDVDGGDDELTTPALHLYRVNGDRVLYDMPLAARRPLQQKYLMSTDSYLLDTGESRPLSVWVGSEADQDAVFDAVHRAQTYAQFHGCSNTRAICRLMEGEETNEFKTLFSGWRDRSVKERQLSRSYTSANIDRALSSRTDRRTVAKLEEVWSDDHFITGEGSNQLWCVQGERIVRLPLEELGSFSNRSCYIILHRTEPTNCELVGTRTLYYWVGSKCRKEEELQAHKSACAIDASLWYTCTVLRVLDGREPRHFFSVLHGSMIVYDNDQSSSGHLEQYTRLKSKPLHGTNVFCVREMGTESMRIEEVPPLMSYFNSSAAYIIISEATLLIWYGKNARGNEREYAKDMLEYFCPERCRNYNIINEGKENGTFWLLIENNGDYPEEFCKQKLHRRIPSLARCELYRNKWCFQDIPNFSQDDLIEKRFFVLDTHDQILVWCGSGVKDKDFTVHSSLLKDYLNHDPCVRCREDINIWHVNQQYEPVIFTKHFKMWEVDGYGGYLAYQAARKMLRQENALIDIDCQMIDPACINSVKVPYKELVNGETLCTLHTEVDGEHRENHLTDLEFVRVLHHSRAQFYRLPKWKRQQILASARLDANSFTTSQLLSFNKDGQVTSTRTSTSQGRLTASR